MESALTAYLRGRFGVEQTLEIEARWRANFRVGEGAAAPCSHRHEEYDDLLALLQEHAREDSEEIGAVARWLAFSCMGENHLWEDLGLAERPALTSLIAECFPRLREMNSHNMRWKKFFYKQLCNRAQVFACRAPTCDQCSEFALCFESPDAGEPGWQFPRALTVRDPQQSNALGAYSALRGVRLHRMLGFLRK
ncbi:MAG TPA: nitrogen fixation protein NifQ [Burkholderiaceae bacterium]|nr:nitrogen fixation protein NifQ [Burkholderiaceae bacterium]